MSISKARIDKVGNYYIEFYNNEELEENIYEIEYSQPIIDNIEINGFENKRLESSTYINTIHYGNYENISDAYNELYKWANENGFKIKGNFIEKYFIDSSLTSSSNEFITEVSIKVLKN